MKRKRTFRMIVKLSLFALILTLGTLIVFNTGETESMARFNLSNVAVDRIVTTADSEILYAEIAGDSQADGFYRSVDNGRTWENLSPGPETQVNVLSVDAGDDSILYAGGLGGSMETTRNLWRSLDGGHSWQQFSLNLPASPDRILPAITALATDPLRPYGLYVGTDGQGVYRVDKSYPGYELVGGTSMYNGHVKSLVVGANSQLFALTTEGLFVTTGHKWQQVEIPETFISLAAAPDDKQTLYGGGASMGVYRSTDSGQSWESMNEGLPLIPGAALRVTALTVDKALPQSLAIATAQGIGSQLAPDGIYQSDSGGAWVKVANLDSLVTNLSLNKGVVHATTVTGLQRFDQGGETALEAASTIPTAEAGSLSSPSTIQIVILLLTVAVAVLILINPLHWLEGWREQAGDK